MSNAAVVQDETEDRYYTQVEAGDVRLFTLDQLDAAFNAGLIHENTYVCLEGESEWLTLGEVAGLGQEEEEAPASAPQLIAQPVSVSSHVAQPFAPAVQPVPQRVTQPIAPVMQPVPHRPAAPAQVATNPFGLAPSPSIAPSAATYSAPPLGISPSLRPVVNDLSLDDDLDMLSMRPKRRVGKVVAGVAVLALAGLGFAVVQSGGLRLPKLNADSAQASAASMSLDSVKQAETPKPIVAPVPEPAVAEAAKPEPPKEEVKAAEGSADETGTDKAKKTEDDRFSEEMKAALLNKDKKQAVTTKQKKASRASVAAKFKGSSKAAKGSNNFKSGGSAYDPLNGKL